MSLVDDSLLNSSSIDDFAAYLDTELESMSDTSPEPEDHANEIRCIDTSRNIRRKLEVLEGVAEANDSTSRGEIKALEASAKEYTCTHPGLIGKMCIKCGEEMINQTGGIAFEYIHKGLWLANDEIVRLRERNLKNLFSRKKLCLVLDLDHTLLHSTPLTHITQEEGYLLNESDPFQDALKGSLFKLNSLKMLTKLRPFVHTFLKEASQLFEMYIYTMADRFYALEMANLLDPQKIYFDSRIIAKPDCTQKRKKGLDVVLGQESAVLILDDTKEVWMKDKANLIQMEKYDFFASSYKHLPYKYKSLSESKCDESDSEGNLANVLQVLKRIHSLFFDPELGDNFAGRDVRQVLMTVRGEILKGCKITFSRTFQAKSHEQNHPLWDLAGQMGATCVKEVDPSVTHVVAAYVGTRTSLWAVEQKKFLVEPRWLQAAYYLWQKQPEDKFTVTQIVANK